MPPTLPFLAGFAAGLWWNHSDPWLMQNGGDHGLRMVTGTLIAAAGAALFWTGSGRSCGSAPASCCSSLPRES